MSLFQPITLGPFQLQHRVVISPPLRHVHDDVEKYFEELKPEGGLVLVPSLAHLDVKAHQNIVKSIHRATGIAFCRIGNIQQLSTAVAAGYDGVEIDAGEGTALQRDLHKRPAPKTSPLLNLLHSATTVIPAERIGIRFGPFTIIDGNCIPKLLSVYITLIDEIKHRFPSLAFVHIFAETMFDDFDHPRGQPLDVFRAAVAFSSSSYTGNKSAPIFVSSNAYTSVRAHAVAARTTDMICIGLAADTCSEITSQIRKGSAYRLPKTISSRLAKINGAFRQGKEYALEWDHGQMKELNHLKPYLAFLDSCKETRENPCWFASYGIGEPLLQTESELSELNADIVGGRYGLRLLQDRRFREAISYLKYILDNALVTTCNALGIYKALESSDEIIHRCTIRYQIRRLDSTIHADPHLLTAVIASGIRVYDIDGAVRHPVANSTIVMGGTTLYRWSEGKYLPTFYELGPINQGRLSIVAFFDFPDMTSVPQAGKGTMFFLDAHRIQEDDQSRTGEIAPLNDIMAERHKLNFPLTGKGIGREK